MIGAGPAGLAVGACLRQAGVPFAILEQQKEVGSAWRSHYDRLHLHTDKAHSELPFAPYPKDYPKYPSRLQFVRYLEAYAERFRLTPQFGQAVTSLTWSDGHWETQTQVARYRSTNVVVATGNTRDPKVPSWPGQESFPGLVLHSSRYRNGEPYRGQRVLIVGCGNSGGEIAIDLCDHGAHPSIAVRSPVNVIPRELFGLPILSVAVVASMLPVSMADALTAPVLRLMYGDLTELGFRKLPYGPLAQIKRDSQIPLIDIGAIDLVKAGRVCVREGVERFVGNEVRFRDGKQEPYDTVILATGYRPRVDDFLRGVDALLDEDGTPIRSGVEAARGLFFCGFHVPATGVLHGIAREAKRIAADISRTSVGNRDGRRRPAGPSRG